MRRTRCPGGPSRDRHGPWTGATAAPTPAPSRPCRRRSRSWRNGRRCGRCSSSSATATARTGRSSARSPSSASRASRRTRPAPLTCSLTCAATGPSRCIIMSVMSHSGRTGTVPPPRTRPSPPSATPSPAPSACSSSRASPPSSAPAAVTPTTCPSSSSASQPYPRHPPDTTSRPRRYQTSPAADSRYNRNATVGSPGASQPPAPTDPGVNLSVHRALVILVTRRAGPKEPISSARTCGVSLGDPLPALHGFLLGLQPVILLADPAHQIGVDARQERIQRGAVKRAVVLHPASHDRIDFPCEFGEGMAGTQMQSPGLHLCTEPFQGILTDCRINRAELPPVLVPHPALPEREPQEGERGVFVRTTPLAVLAVHDLCLTGMQPQPDLLHSLSDRRHHSVGLGFAFAVHHCVIHVTFERDGRELPGHPCIERVVQEQISQHR